MGTQVKRRHICRTIKRWRTTGKEEQENRLQVKGEVIKYEMSTHDKASVVTVLKLKVIFPGSM